MKLKMRERLEQAEMVRLRKLFRPMSVEKQKAMFNGILNKALTASGKEKKALLWVLWFFTETPEDEWIKSMLLQDWKCDF